MERRDRESPEESRSISEALGAPPLEWVARCYLCAVRVELRDEAAARERGWRGFAELVEERRGGRRVFLGTCPTCTALRASARAVNGTGDPKRDAARAAELAALAMRDAVQRCLELGLDVEGPAFSVRRSGGDPVRGPVPRLTVEIHLRIVDSAELVRVVG